MKLLKKHRANNFTYLFFIIFLLPAFLLAGCNTTDSGESINLEGSWSPAGLEGVKVNVLQPDTDGLFTGTEAGLYIFEENSINILGLTDYGIRGVVRTGDQSLLVGVNRDDADHPAFLRWQNESSGWEPFQNNYGDEDKINFVYRFARVAVYRSYSFRPCLVRRGYWYFPTLSI